MLNTIFKEFEQCYALEMPHGQTKVVDYNDLYTFDEFSVTTDDLLTVNAEALFTGLKAFNQPSVALYGKIIASGQWVLYDVSMNGDWLDVRTAHTLAIYLKLPFVEYETISSDTVDEVGLKDNIELRPMKECVDEDGNRIIHRKERKIGFKLDEAVLKELTEQRKLEKIIDGIEVKVEHVYEKKEDKQDENSY